MVHVFSGVFFSLDLVNKHMRMLEMPTVIIGCVRFSGLAAVASQCGQKVCAEVLMRRCALTAMTSATTACWLPNDP